MSKFIDAKRDELGSDMQANVCIVGAGAAGLSLARKLSKTVSDILLVESGDFALDGVTQSLFSGHQLGLPYHALTSCRLRYWGGTTNHWSGYCRANDPIDYEGRSELDLPTWPVNHDDLEAYISEAADELGLSAGQFDAAQALQDAGLNDQHLLDDESDILSTKVAQFAEDKRLGPRYRDDVENNPNITPILNLNLTHIQLSHDAQRVEHCDFATLNGKKVKVTANLFVIATHGIENARQLLTSNDVMTSGIGNEYDHVGRYFMDHIAFKASAMIPSAQFPLHLDEEFAKKRNFNANLSLTDDYLRDNEMLQYYCRFVPAQNEMLWETARQVRAGINRPGSLEFLSDVAELVNSIPTNWGQWQRKAQLNWPLPEVYYLEQRLEQAPNPNSRVVVSDRRDAVGNLIADLDWQITDHDVRSFAKGQDAMIREISALGLGRVQAEEINRELVEERLFGHYHQIGTTRMSTAAQDGVVDANCRVHGVGNLYIAGSSVFPTAGYSGPTMMIMALAYRLADHIRSKI